MQEWTFVETIKEGGIAVFPHVTNMQDGTFRPEVAYSKGPGSDIIFGVPLAAKAAAEFVAVQAAVLATLSDPELLWSEVSRLVAAVAAAIC